MNQIFCRHEMPSNPMEDIKFNSDNRSAILAVNSKVNRIRLCIKNVLSLQMIPDFNCKFNDELFFVGGKFVRGIYSDDNSAEIKKYRCLYKEDNNTFEKKINRYIVFGSNCIWEFYGTDISLEAEENLNIKYINIKDASKFMS